MSAGDASTAAVARRLGHEFSDAALLRIALTHRSASGPNNERLEFLGDAVLGMLIAESLFARDPRTSEGALSRMRASLVNAKVLAEIGRELALGDALLLGAGELKSGGFRRESILADTVEALVGAVYLDAGIDAARACVARLYGGRLDALPTAEALKDPKTRLQELLQKRGLGLPEYTLLASWGADHDQTFRVRCQVSALDISAEAEGRSRRAAEQGAAEAALGSLDDR